MRGRTIVFVAILTLFASALWLTGSALRRTPFAPVPIDGSASWDPRAAAAYLDQRQTWWESWPKAARDHNTVCVSCHTALPYALARPELGAALHEEAAPPAETRLIGDVVTRVRAWRDVKPFYGDTTPAGRTKAVQSRGTEAVLNALILASRDRRAHVASPEARQAFANMFALQESSGDEAGAWPWLNFGLRPWESTTSDYFGAALAAVAVGMEPQNYAASPEIQPNVQRLRAYLHAHLDQSLWNRLLRRDDPRLFNRAMLLWACAELPGLISTEEQRAIVASLEDAQDPDGSWRLTSLGYWRPAKGVPDESQGDAVATGLVAFALQQAGSDAREPHVARALAWLAQHQDRATGMWAASSLNKVRDPATGVGKFMTDAATGYAALALTAASSRSPAP